MLMLDGFSLSIDRFFRPVIKKKSGRDETVGAKIQEGFSQKDSFFARRERLRLVARGRTYDTPTRDEPYDRASKVKSQSLKSKSRLLS